MKKDKVTVKDLRAIPRGGTETFTLPGIAAVRSARQLTQIYKIDIGPFTTSVSADELTITITRL